jgi:fructose-1,6-bisphosphatase/inositol monophosphatase family enzyme
MQTTSNDALAALWLPRLLELQERIRGALQASLARQDLERQSLVVRDDSEGDTIFAIDVDAEEILLEACERWASDSSFLLVAEGIEPAAGRRFGSGTPNARLICDPIDGTRGLMFDKRSAWSLAAVAPERGPTPRLSEVVVAAMTELPTTRHGCVDVLWTAQGEPTVGRRVQLADGSARDFAPRPSTATTLRHGFATVCNFFQGGKELTSRLEEDFIAAALGGWDHRKAEVYVDQYISSGGQLAELALGRDRFVLDVRPLVHRAMGHADTLCSKPYDLCTASIAQAAGCVVTAPDGRPLDPPLDLSTNVAFVGFANQRLAQRLQPLLTEALRRHGLLGSDPT